MKIIKEGKLPEREEFVNTCLYCKTIYEFIKDECKYRSFPKNESFYVVKCPFCNKFNYIDYDDLPKLRKMIGE